MQNHQGAWHLPHGSFRRRRGQFFYIEESADRFRTRKGKKDLDEEWKEIRRGWFLGYSDFRAFLLGKLEGALSGEAITPLSAPERKEHGEGRAREILDAGLRLYSITRENLSESPMIAEVERDEGGLYSRGKKQTAKILK